jgi:anthranilate phosphoribosyltransferase
VQLLGVADSARLRPIAETLRALRVERALVVHGSGLDEIALHAFTQAVQLQDGELEEVELTPEQAGLGRMPAEQIVGGSPEENARRLSALLSGRGAAADEAVVALNAGALLAIAGKAADFRDGVGAALDAIRSGDANRVLTAFVEASHG